MSVPPYPGVGSERASRRRDVELQLGDLLADRYKRLAPGVDPATTRWPRSGPERWARSGSPPAGVTAPQLTPSGMRRARADHARVSKFADWAPCLIKLSNLNEALTGR